MMLLETKDELADKIRLTYALADSLTQPPENPNTISTIAQEITIQICGIEDALKNDALACYG